MGDVKRFPSTSPRERDFTTLDNLPFGAILVDERGTILFYNRSEEEHAKRSRGDFLGKNFFEIAPCAQVREFHGQFLEVVQGPGFTANFRFDFYLPGAAPRDVEITMASFRYKGELLCLITVSDVTDLE